MNKTKIEYADYSWNPLAMRCTPVSEGCENCWHLAMAKRLAANPKIGAFRRQAYAGTSGAIPADMHKWWPERATEEFMRLKPSVIATQFMGDLWHDSVSFSTISDIVDIIGACFEHKFLLLTKRPTRILEWMQYVLYEHGQNSLDYFDCLDELNMWLGVTCENQRCADERIPALLEIPNLHNWVSLEPLLGPVALDEWLFARHVTGVVASERPPAGVSERWRWTTGDRWEYSVAAPQLDWLVVGCESGPRRRPMQLEWAENIVRQCQEAQVPCFVKQLPINGKVSHNPDEWPPELQVRQLPWPPDVTYAEIECGVEGWYDAC